MRGDVTVCSTDRITNWPLTLFATDKQQHSILAGAANTANALPALQSPVSGYCPENMVTLIKIMERTTRTFLEKVMEVSSYPPSKGKEGVKWRILIRKSGLAEGYTMPSNYPSAGPDLRINIRH